MRTIDSETGREPNNLRRVRRGMGLRLRDVASQAGLGINTVSQIERGVRYGRPQSRRAIARAVGLPVSVVFPEDPMPDPMPDPEGQDA
jgi:transcriptional regulator with XRE-family HTH domain